MHDILTTYVPIIIAGVSLIYAVIQTDLSKKQLKIANLQNIKAKELFSGADEYLENVSAVTTKIDEIINDEYKSENEITILNFGLDLESVMPWFKNKLLQVEDYDETQIKYRGLIINPDSPQLKNLINGTSNIKEVYVASSLESANSIGTSNFKGIDFEIRGYDSIPFFHGFILNRKHLFISYTEVIQGKMDGGNFPYLYIKQDNTSKLNKHIFNMFKSWFEYVWSVSQQRIKFRI